MPNPELISRTSNTQQTNMSDTIVSSYQPNYICNNLINSVTRTVKKYDENHPKPKHWKRFIDKITEYDKLQEKPNGILNQTKEMKACNEVQDAAVPYIKADQNTKNNNAPDQLEPKINSWWNRLFHSNLSKNESNLKNSSNKEEQTIFKMRCRIAKRIYSLVEISKNNAGTLDITKIPTYENESTDVKFDYDENDGSHDLAKSKTLSAKKTQKMPIFSHKPSASDVRQGYLGNCYFLATLAAVARNKPQIIESMFKDLGDGTAAVKLHVPTDKKDKFKCDYTPKYYKTLKVFPGYNYDSALWVLLAERAFVQSQIQQKYLGYSKKDGYDDNSYQQIVGGDETLAARVITGEKLKLDHTWKVIDEKHSLFDELCNQWWNDIKNAVDKNQSIVCGTRSKNEINANSSGEGNCGEAMVQGIALSHAYAITDYKEEDGYRYIKILNPWSSRKGHGYEKDQTGKIIREFATKNNEDGAWIELSRVAKYFRSYAAV